MGTVLPTIGKVELIAPVSSVSLLGNNICEMKFLYKTEGPPSPYGLRHGKQMAGDRIWALENLEHLEL